MTLQLWGKQGPSLTPFQGLHHKVHVATQKYGLCSGMYDLGQKKPLYFLFLYHFDSLVQDGQTHGLVHNDFTCNR